jgi:hypothetical protein
MVNRWFCERIEKNAQRTDLLRDKSEAFSPLAGNPFWIAILPIGFTAR